MSQMRPRIIVDPFFDGEGRRPQLPTAPADRLGHDYVSPNDVASGISGQPISTLIRSGPPGLPQVVVPSQIGPNSGISPTVNPHANDRRVTIDPHIRGQSVEVNLRDLTPETMRRGMAAAAAALPRANNAPTQRLHAAAAFHMAAHDIESGHAPQAQPAARRGRPVRQSEPADEAPQRFTARARQLDLEDAPRPSPMQAFSRGVAASPQERRPAEAPYREARMPSEPALRNVDVVFEFTSDGVPETTEASYHDVIIHDSCIVLVSRLSDRAYQPARPQDRPRPRTDQAVPLGRRIALQIVDDPMAYLVHATPFVYTCGEYRHTILRLLVGLDTREPSHDGEASSSGPGDNPEPTAEPAQPE